MSTNQQSFSSGPPEGPPPNYSNDDSFEMKNPGPCFPPPLGPPPAGPQNLPAPYPGDRPFAFYKPQRDPRTKLYIGMLVFLTIVITIMATVLGLTISSHKEAAVQLPYSTTISTISTPLVSTETLSCTATAVSATTQVTTQTGTQTSLLSNGPRPTSVPGCWSLLQDLCSNKTEIDPGVLYQEYWDQCEEIYSIFYCGVIQQLDNQHIFNIPANTSPFCDGMLAFCDRIEMGEPLLLRSMAPATSTSPILQLITPVSKRRFVATMLGHTKMLPSRIRHPTRVPGPLPTNNPDNQALSSGCKEPDDFRRTRGDFAVRQY
ncbi:hypothetical protein NA56DRAFT_722691 [Hyaloscypha hepaticicola]|uniref:Uncharacterized protein n=1 Tax=Hyaloscypha hepaticicola TaxID=2082293 RepID=A0A2J6Q3C6_9HELO|nr:hypothetical protein NA56DRAFT_722691 [Hyaloscypha hepaticicola]